MKELKLWCVWISSKQKFVMRYRDEHGVMQQAGTCKSRKRSGAERERAELEAALNNPDSPASPRGDLALTEIHERYKKARLSTKSRDYGYQLEAGLKRLRAVAVDRGIEEITARHITTDFVAAAIELLCEEVELPTARSYRTALRAFFRWANGLDLVRPVNWSTCSVECAVQSGGRPLTGEEFERMLAVTPKVVGKARAPAFQTLMRGCYLSGMRLGEATQLNAFRQDCHHIDRPPQKAPRIVFLPTQKNRTAQSVVMLPEFDEFLRTVEPNAEGFYFAPLNGNGDPYTVTKDVGRVISSIGRKAKIAVKFDEEGNVKKYASAHDFRRSWAYRLVARGVKCFTLQHLMRHADPKTTQQFYSGDIADLVASELWDAQSLESIEMEVASQIA